VVLYYSESHSVSVPCHICPIRSFRPHLSFKDIALLHPSLDRLVFIQKNIRVRKEEQDHLKGGVPGSACPKTFVSRLPLAIFRKVFPPVFGQTSRILSLSLPLYRTYSYERQGLCWVGLVICALASRGAPLFGGCRTDCGSGLMSYSNLSWNTTDDTLRDVSVVFLST
jgi:hypothetical protein